MISVVVPIYQSRSTISQCVESIMRQTYQDIQIVLVDDGSNDGSSELCEELAARDSRIEVIHQANQGRSVARCNGVIQSKGEWLFFVDSDDMLPTDALRLLYERVSNDVDIVFGNGYTLCNEQRAQVPIDDFRHLAVRSEGTIGVPWGSLYRRKVLSSSLFDLPREIYNGEDYIFWLRLIFSTDKPVNIVYEKVYLKGDEHTSGSFVWTAAYAQRLQQYRLKSIPQSLRHQYLSDALADRIANLFDVAVWSPRQEWISSQFYRDIISDLSSLGKCLTLRQRFFLSVPSLRLRRVISRLLQSR